MKVSEFVEKFKESTNKDSYVKRHIKRKYIPYIEKIISSQTIIDSSMYITDEKTGINKFKINTPKRYMLTVVKAVQLYTDLDIDASSLLSDFDLLNESGAINIILAHVEDDFKVFQTVVDMTVDDTIDTERNYQGYIEKKYDEFVAMMKLLAEQE